MEKAVWSFHYDMFLPSFSHVNRFHSETDGEASRYVRHIIFPAPESIEGTRLKYVFILLTCMYIPQYKPQCRHAICLGRDRKYTLSTGLVPGDTPVASPQGPT